MTEQPIWQPKPQHIKDSQLSRFTDFVNQQHNLTLNGYSQLHDYSINNRGQFWRDIINFCGVIYHQDAVQDLQDDGHMIEAEWFAGMTLNFAENLLRKNDDDLAINFTDEQGQTVNYSYRELHQKVAQIQQKLMQCGVTSGDRVVAFMPNIPETIMAMLAATSLGAVWSSTSPDFGMNGVVDRFGQIEPKVLFCANAYYYNGKTHDCLEKVGHINQQISSIEHIVVVDFVEQTNDTLPDNAVYLSDWLANTDNTAQVEFTPVAFDHPLYILYSSGTTGKPKCIVHRTGGILLQHLKELQIHSNITSDKSLFYFTTCGWMMWNWLVSGLATGATVVLYDGSPFYPDGNRLFDLIDAQKISHFGTSAKWISAVEKAGLKPKKSHDLSSLETIFSTGSPLLPENFDFVYRDVKQDVCLSSISGGTDICSCFALGCSDLPVYRGQLQCLGLGLSVKVLDEDKKSLIGEPGELACDKAFPAMPVYFWHDENNEKYKAAYFDKYPDIWCHSDRAEITPQGGMIIYGRSDTTLNPGGVRIGTAEIYRQVEKHTEILESIVVGQEWGDDTRVILFVVMQKGYQLDDELIKQIKTTIRQNTTPRHVPAKIIAVTDIPKTISGKMVELAVRDVIHGKEVANTDALANPEALDLYKDLPELNS
ncbi:acetoacetate--CoA ligase [Marinicella gelatinilytica]|uniref:acetoacetate--CoA ligase n=1 Tax=Marinicella gelatinilytica TaxID=2996017 RepID=UPI002260ABCC|nr:acetoacetate--CoA ligase [Marinicella gelatinilytica]MCX7545761.1 acetoacetate--CoA ligase [Marinicella gelatinilytica]